MVSKNLKISVSKFERYGCYIEMIYIVSAFFVLLKKNSIEGIK